MIFFSYNFFQFYSFNIHKTENLSPLSLLVGFRIQAVKQVMSSPKSLEKRNIPFSPNFLRRRHSFEKTGQQKAFLGTFWKISIKKSRFLARTSPVANNTILLISFN